MTVLIAGAGIAGLTLGLSLHQAGVPFRIFEAVREIRPLGVGINLQPHAVRELFELGLEERLDEIGLRTEEVAYFNRFGQLIWAEPRGMRAGYRWPQFSIHRGHLQVMLHRALMERCRGSVKLGTAVTDWRETPRGIEIALSDRKSGADLGRIEGAVLVACDGINSALRARLFPNEGPARWSGTMLWRGCSQGRRFRTGRTVAMTGSKTAKFVAYPIADIGPESLINWIADLKMPEGHDWARQDWNRRGALPDFLPRFADWTFDWLDIPDLISATPTIYEYPMVDRDPLDRWTYGSMTLLGDAAHAMYPIGSNGASQAVLDTRVLARCLRDLGVGPEALGAYEAERRPAANALVLANRGDGPDRILDIVDARAPDGFEDIESVMPEKERAAFAEDYKSVAGMDIEALNNRPPILGAVQESE